MRFITYCYEAENGENEVDVEYEISKYYPATREQPQEGGEVELHSVKLNGVEVELTENEIVSLIQYIEDNDDLSDDEYYYEDDEEE
jgi:hypothetical protein